MRFPLVEFVTEIRESVGLGRLRVQQVHQLSINKCTANALEVTAF